MNALRRALATVFPRGNGAAETAPAFPRALTARLWQWAAAQVRDLGAHPARLCWTLVVSLAYFAAERPIWSYAQGLWASFSTFFLVNAQVDYGEGPLFNQEVLLYHGRDIYQLVNKPPFAFGNYPPVFPLVASLLMRLHAVGVTFLAGRLTSSLAIMGAGVVAALIVLQATRQLLPALLAAGILLTFSEIHDWGPYNRVDSLALFLSLCTVFVALRYGGTRKAWWVLPFAVLTVYTRQSSVDGIVAAFVFLFWRDWRRCLTIGTASLAAVLGVFVGLQVWSHGAFYLNTVVFNENAWSWSGTLSNWSGWAHAQGRIPFRLAVAGAAAGLLGRGRVLWPVWLAASVGVFATIGKTGSSVNYFFPLDAAVAVCAGVFVGQFRTFFRRAPFPLWPVELILPAMLFVYVHGTPPGWLPARLPLLPRLEAAAGSYSLNRSAAAAAARGLELTRRRDAALRAQGHPVPRRHLTTPASVTTLARFYASVPGPVLALDFPRAEVVQGGKQMQWQPFEFGVVYGDGHWNPAPFLGAIEDRYYGVVVLQSLTQFMGYDGDFGASVISAIQANYHLDGSVGGLQVWRPDSPPLAAAPPVLPIAVPQPLSQLRAAILRALLRLPAALAAGRSGGSPRSIGAFTEVGTGRLDDLALAEPPGGSAGLGFDGIGDVFPAAQVPPAGTLFVRAGGARVPFYMPPAADGQPAAIYLGVAVTVPLPAPRRDGAVWLLGAGVNGPQAVPVTADYAGGERRALSVTLSDWCGAAVAGEASAFRASQILEFSGGATDRACGLFAVRVALDPGRVLEGVTLGPASNARVVAVTLQGA